MLSDLRRVVQSCKSLVAASATLGWVMVARGAAFFAGCALGSCPSGLVFDECFGVV